MNFLEKNILYDNLKSVVIQRNAYGVAKHKFNKKFLDFSKTYGFIPMLCKEQKQKARLRDLLDI